MLFLFLASHPDQPDTLNEETNLTFTMVGQAWKEPSHKGRPIVRYLFWQRQFYPYLSGRSGFEMIHNQTKSLNITLKRNTTSEIAVTPGK